MNIQIVEKPDWISFDDVANLLHDAHKSTILAGMNFGAATITGLDIQKQLEKNGVLFVALIDENILAGVIGISFYPKNNSWFGRGESFGRIKMVGVGTNYKRMGINNLLYKKACEYAFEKVDLLEMNTAEKNQIVVSSNLRHGWRCVDYRCFSNTNYYSVVMAKWKNCCPFTQFEIMFNFIIRKVIIKLRYKPGKIRRF